MAEHLCDLCKRPLDNPEDPTTKNCGGTCLKCMAEIGGDPDCVIAMERIAEIERDPASVMSEEPTVMDGTEFDGDLETAKILIPRLRTAIIVAATTLGYTEDEGRELVDEAEAGHYG